MFQIVSENDAQATEQSRSVKEMTPDEIRARIVELGFEGDAARF